MDIALVSFTRPGKALADKLADALTAKGHICRFAKFADAGELFARVHGIIFVGATGIAVRAIAPYVTSKYTDPAVVVCDEQGLFAISLLSGHEGGANELTREIAEIIGATPVITTASELRTLIVGCGCRRGTSAEQIDAAFMSAGIWPERIVKLCTIDIKRDEPGLLAFAEKYNIPIDFFSAAQLMQVTGAFTGSDFVKDTTGADNVCERAAVLGSGGGQLILQKYTANGVAVAVAEVSHG
ncbi:MAG: cobalamin biosynthesis protein [Oscillospiraceae bacterium]|nr:cobalamin biosynthesis protein [Oscillospiraceae bacterium]